MSGVIALTRPRVVAGVGMSQRGSPLSQLPLAVRPLSSPSANDPIARREVWRANRALRMTHNTRRGCGARLRDCGPRAPLTSVRKGGRPRSLTTTRFGCCTSSSCLTVMKPPIWGVFVSSGVRTPVQSGDGRGRWRGALAVRGGGLERQQQNDTDNRRYEIGEDRMASNRVAESLPQPHPTRDVCLDCLTRRWTIPTGQTASASRFLASSGHSAPSQSTSAPICV
jgi:hypothetical protein